MNECNVRSHLGCIYAMKQSDTTGWLHATLKQKVAVGLGVTTRHKE